MPELPEVETIRRQLNQVIPNQTIKDIKIHDPKRVILNPSQLIGLKVKQLSRRAKVIIITFHQSNIVLLIHLKMTGQLIYVSPETKITGGHPTKDWLSDLPVKSTRTVFTLDKGRLFFNDQRGFGWIRQINTHDLAKHLANYSRVEPLSRTFTAKYLESICRLTGQPIKNLLHNQSKLAGLGNIYINDALWLARIHPLKPANQLTIKQVRRLHRAINRVIKEGLTAGGASDNTYVNAFGLGGSYQESFKVYRQQGKPCSRHKSQTIQRLKIGSRSAFFCPRCQFI